MRRSADRLSVRVQEAGAEEIGRRSRGTPRIANHLLKRVRDFAEVEADGCVSANMAASALERLGDAGIPVIMVTIGLSAVLKALIQWLTASLLET